MKLHRASQPIPAPQRQPPWRLLNPPMHMLNLKGCGHPTPVLLRWEA
jgi:hypothetical protein